MNYSVFFKPVFWLLILLIFVSGMLSGQSKQTIRGIVTDEITEMPLPGATVMIVGSNPLKGTVTGNDGGFKLENLPLGSYTLKISYVGYKDKIISGLDLFAGKEIVLDIKMQEKVLKIKEAVIKAKIRREKPMNEMAAVSAVMFTPKETQMYAGTLGDPSRMVQNYAGVMSAGDSRNDIIIRGNSPMGLLWKLEGVHIPNPNHFAATGTTGGPVTILNNNLLTNSDFFTGAFPAEYGNALSGAFDLNMRSGNNEKYEFVGQIGFNGFEVGAEGPFSKKSNASFLADYRYSTLAVLNALGIKSMGGSSVPQYQDFTFKIDVPTLKTGRWTLFGIGGLSFIQLWDSLKDDDEFSYGLSGTDTDFGSDMGVAGLSNLFFINKKTKLKNSIYISGTRTTTSVDSLIGEDKIKRQFYRSSNSEVTYGFSSKLTHKFSAKDIITGGIILELYKVAYIDSVYRNETDDFFRNTDVSGNIGLYQAFSQWKHNFSDNFNINGGLHFQYFGLNGSKSVEPRAGLEWQFLPGKTLSFGYGLLSQTQPKILYFVRTELPDGTIDYTNRNLDFTKSNQFVLGYQQMIGKLWRFKTEVYYQKLYDVPVRENTPDYSVLNEGAYFHINLYDSLINKGTGTNYGVEFTLEKFFENNYYLLSNVSLFRSLYKGYNGKEHPTAFDNRYVINVLGGYRFLLKNNILNIDLKGVFAGGKPYTPVDEEASKEQYQPVYIENLAFSQRHKDYFRIDLKISFRMNMGKTDQEFALEIQNLTNHKNVFQQVWDPKSKEFVIDYQQGFYPMFLFRIYF